MAPRPSAAPPSTRGYAPTTEADPTRLPAQLADSECGWQVYFRKGLVVELLRVKLPNWVVNVVCKIYVKASKVRISPPNLSATPRPYNILPHSSALRNFIRKVEPSEKCTRDLVMTTVCGFPPAQGGDGGEGPAGDQRGPGLRAAAASGAAPFCIESRTDYALRFRMVGRCDFECKAYTKLSRCG